jgi:hypothetical protein
MTHTMQRIALLAFFSLFGGLFSLACHAGPQAYANTQVTTDPPACVTDSVLLQATTSTPARVSAAPGEHVALHMDHPLGIDPGDPGDKRQPLNMYLLAGDAVEVIATCENYAYVRYQGAKLVSAGWIEAGHLKYVGPRHARPQDTVAQVCAAAANIINGQASDVTALPYVSFSKLPKEDGTARIMIGGKARKVAPVIEGGTCPDDYLKIWSDDLSHAIGSTDPIGGGFESLVQVLGHPLVVQSYYNDPTTFTLSSLDKDGQASVICQATRVPTTMPRDISGSTNPVCRAVVSNQATAIPVQNVSEKFLSLPADTARKYPSTSGPRPFALGVGKADLFNEGKPHDVGLVSFHLHVDRDCGWNVDATSPVILNAQGVADLTDATNKRLIKETTGSDDLDDDGQASSGGRLITYAGSTYFVKHAEPVNTPTNDALVSVLRFTSAGSETVCRFQPYSFVVTPAAGRAGQVVP